MKISDLKIGVFAYNFPHKKSYDFISRMLAEGIPIKLVLAADPVKLHIAEPSIRTKLRHEQSLHPRIMSSNFGLNYKVCPHNSEETIACIKDLDLDIGIVAGARILKENVIHSFKLGVINFHPGLLPQIRGLDALLWSIHKNVPLAVTSHLIDKKIDAGFVIEKKLIKVFKDDSVFDITERLYETQLGMIKDSLIKVVSNEVESLEIKEPYNTKMSVEMEKLTLEQLPVYLEKFASH